MKKYFYIFILFFIQATVLSCTDEEIYETVQIQEGNKAQRLIDMANANGGKDNITVIIVEPFTNEVREC